MSDSHYVALLAGYSVALAGWLVAFKVLPGLWPPATPPEFEKPWREIGYALLAVLAILLIGQMYQRDWLLPRAASFQPLTESVNQAIIFSPLPLLLYIRKHSLLTAWLPLTRVWVRVLVGLVLALLAATAFKLIRHDSPAWPHLVAGIYQLGHLPHLVQVFFEDLGIAILFVRLRAAIGLRWSIGLTAAGFAAAHIPAMISDGASTTELSHLVLDTGLAVIAIAIVQRSADIWWFWCVHFAMDMTQFVPIVKGDMP